MKAIILALIINLVLTQVTILGPQDLIQIMKQTSSSGDIDYRLGNFGEIPYGKTIVGYTYYQGEGGDNTWCDIERIKPIPDIRDPDVDYSPLFIVDHGGCSYTRKAYNVRAKGGRVMVLVSDDASFHHEMNVDDKLGERIDIPSVIISNADGSSIIRYMNTHPDNKVIMAVKFVSVKENGELNVELYMRSDDVKALHFFKEFKNFYELLKNKINFRPVYKYYKYPWLGSSNELSTSITDGCIKDSAYCGTDNENLRISNPRVMLMENIRQSCIFKLNTKDPSIYWNYMIQFSDTCADLNNPIFTEECSKNIIKYEGLDNAAIEECMKKEIEDYGFIENDYDKYEKRKVYRVPQILINGVKYKGSWYSKYIFDAICTGFLDDNSVCNIKPKEDKVDNSGYGFGIIFLITIIITLIMLVVLYCYRRVVNKQLEQSLNEKIQTQTIFSLGQYQVFKDDTGKKSVDVTKL